MKAWFKISELRSRTGIITDYFINYIELFDNEAKEYHIIHEDKVDLIGKKSLNLNNN